MEPIRIASPRIDPTAFVAPGAHIYGDVAVAAEAVIMFGAVLRSEEDSITVGPRSNIQDNVVIHTDVGFPTTIGADVTVGHAAVIHGATVGDHCLVGIGSRLLNGAELGEGAWLAAGALLPEGKSIPPWTIGVGVPAKPMRELTEAEIERQRDGAATYLRLAAAYRELLS